MPVPLNAAADADPFAGFKTDKGGGRIVQPDDPVSATEAKFENLDPGSQYVRQYFDDASLLFFLVELTRALSRTVASYLCRFTLTYAHSDGLL